MTNEATSPLYLRPALPKSEEPFAGDLFDRKQLADRLTSLLERLPDGAVLAIDAPWGNGKTWFGRNWHSLLEKDGYRTAYIDCFERDHLEDPFVMIAGELLTLAKTGKSTRRQSLLEAGKKLGATLLPSVAKLAVNTLGHLAMGKSDLGEDVKKALDALDDSAAASLEKLIAAKLEGYEADKKSIEGFRTALSELAAEDLKPIIVFMDELDRCRPDFAVRTIERMKHFFEAPKVIFVLLMNRVQLEAAIKGIYGPLINADAYLGKFIQLSLRLPKQASLDLHRPDDNQKHCDDTLARYGFPKSQAFGQFALVMGVLATWFDMSLRDVERAVVLFSLGQPIQVSTAYLAWPIALKLAKPDLFARLVANDKTAHTEASRLAAEVCAGAPSVQSAIKLLEEVHKSGANGFTTELPKDQAHLLSFPIGGGMGPAGNFFMWLFQRVDLNIARF